jgi:hypothetical protein
MIAKYGLPSVVALLAGCSRAPSFDVEGALFPAWLPCLAIGIASSGSGEMGHHASRRYDRFSSSDISEPGHRYYIRAMAGLLPMRLPMTPTSMTKDTRYRSLAGRVIGAVIVIAAAILGSMVIQSGNEHPRTDDVEVLANFIGKAPQVEGPITRLNVHDNQAVKKGELLFEIENVLMSTLSKERSRNRLRWKDK